MKKNLKSFSIILLGFLLICGSFSSCASTKLEQTQEKVNDLTEILEDFDGVDVDILSKKQLDDLQKRKQKIEKQLEKEKKKLEKEQKKNEKKQEKSADKPEKQEKAAEEEEELSAFPKEFTKDRGIIHLRYKRTLGTFGISVFDEENKAYPVLSTGNEFTKSGFYLKAGSKIYRLISSKQVSSEVTNSANGMTIVYTVEGVAKVNVQFEMLTIAETVDADILKITSTVENLGTRNEFFALKGIFDTILGESSKYHFYDDNNQPVKSELVIRDAKKVPYITSKNNNTTLQFIIAGADISRLQMVALANYSTLEKSTWEPEMLSFRSFDTLMSYNNSAVALIWPEEKLSPEKKTSYTFYMTFSTGDSKPSGVAYIKNLDKDTSLKTVGAGAEKSEVSLITENEIIEPEQNKNIKDSRVEEISPVVETKPANPSVKFDVNNLSKEQLSPEYIQQLIDKINALEEDGSSINRNEILQLNAELDAILESLRQ